MILNWNEIFSVGFIVLDIIIIIVMKKCKVETEL